MLIADVIRYLEEIFPRTYAESFDNTGLLVGDPTQKLSGIIVAHDVLEEVVEEAYRKKANLIIAFHPIIFSGLKSLTGKTYVERTVMKAIKYGVAIYSPHTALDKHHKGVSYWTGKMLELSDMRVLIPENHTILQLVTYVPHEHVESVRSALFKAGAGHIGEYEECSYNVEGYGTFKPTGNAAPYVGEIGKRHIEPETRISVIFPKHLKEQVLEQMFSAHPYEEPAYEIFILENKNLEIGLGTIGTLSGEFSPLQFLNFVKQKLHTGFLKHSSLPDKKIKKVAILGGSGAFAIEAAKSAGADAFITGDLKYHDFFKAENKILLIDAGHYETEQFVTENLVEIISEKFPKFAVAKSETNTNPVKYF